MRNRRTADPKGDSILSVNRRYNRAMTLMLGENEMPSERESLRNDPLTDSINRDEVPEWHIAELEKRRRAADEQPNAGRPWRDVLKNLGDPGE